MSQQIIDDDGETVFVDDDGETLFIDDDGDFLGLSPSGSITVRYVHEMRGAFTDPP